MPWKKFPTFFWAVDFVMKKIGRILASSIGIISLLIVALCFLVPYIKAVLPAFSSSADLTLSASRIFRIFIYTFLQAFLSMLVALLAGLPAAYLISNTRIPGKRFLVSLGSIPLCIPPLIIALAYISCFGMNGIYNRILMNIFGLNDSPIQILYSFFGVVMVQGFYNFPLVMVTVSDRWTALDSSTECSARILGASRWRVFWTVTFPQLVGSIVSSCIPVFLYCFFSFMIVLLFGSAGGTTLEVAVYHAGRSDLNFSNVAVLSLLETASAFLILFIYSKLENKSERNYQHSFGIKNKRNVPFYIVFYIVLFMFFLMPLFSVVFSSLSAGAWKKVLGMNGIFTAIRNTLITGLSTAVLCTISGFVYALFLRMNDRLKNNLMVKTVPLLPMAVSSVTMGIGFSSLVRHGNPLVLVLAQSALSWPFAFRQIHGQMSNIPREVLQSSLLLSEHKLHSVFSVIIPYAKKGIVSAFCFCFAISAGDATLPLVLSIPKFDTLSLFTYRLAGSYRFKEGAVCALVLGLLCMGVFAIAGIYKRGGKDVS